MAVASLNRIQQGARLARRLWRCSSAVRRRSTASMPRRLPCSTRTTAPVESPVAGVIHGRAGVAKVYRAWFDAFLDMDAQTEKLLIDGEQVVEVLRVEGTSIGEFMRLPASGKRFHFTAVCLFDLRGQQIERERRIYDFTGLLVQVGVLKAKPG